MNRKLTVGHFTDEQAKKVIPKGCYCYDENGVCPFWDKIPEKPSQENGYCHWMKTGDWLHDGISLLWDQCKECGINDDEENYVDIGE